MLRLATPNIVVVLAMSAVTIADAVFVAQLGTTALASLALVFPVQALMQMMSAGAMGGGVSSAVARALGSNDAARASSLSAHGLVIAVAMALLYMVIAGLFAARLFGALGGQGNVLAGAVAYAQIAFGGALAMWLANIAASVLRGTGNMRLPAQVLVVTSLLQVSLSWGLTLGAAGMPALGIRGPATAMVVCYSVAALVLIGCIVTKRSAVTLSPASWRLKKERFFDILRVGVLACGNALLTIATVLVVTRIIASHGTAALAGYGLGNRLEIMIVPVAFGIGGALTATVGANFGARQYARARRIAWTGALVTGAVSLLIGLTAAIWPDAWLSHFSPEAETYVFAARYLAIVGPCYGFFGLGMALYFASQGTGQMRWPFAAGALRFCVVATGSLLAVTVFEAGATSVFALVAFGIVCFCAVLVASLFSRAWRPDAQPS